MFLEYYGMREHPFGVTPDPRYLYLSPTHREALASLVYGIEVGRGFMALVAKPGMGKTTLLFQLLQRLRTSARTVFLFHTQCDWREFLHYLLSDMGIDSQGLDLARMHERLNQVLVAEARAGRRFVLVIDEAQNLGRMVLEEVRLLSDFETPSAKLMQIILAGQQQLAGKLGEPGLAQLQQRISLVTRLRPFGPEETRAYVEHRLQVAGYAGPALFTPEAMEIIATRSEGIPRIINNLCFNALSLGFAVERKTIDAAVINDVLRDLDLKRLTGEDPVVCGTPTAPPGVEWPIREHIRPVPSPGFKLRNKDNDSVIRREALRNPSSLIAKSPAVSEPPQALPAVDRPTQRPDLRSLGEEAVEAPPAVDQPMRWEARPAAQANAQPLVQQSGQFRSAGRVGLTAGLADRGRRTLRYRTVAATLAIACGSILFLEVRRTGVHHGQPQIVSASNNNTQPAPATPSNVKSHVSSRLIPRPSSGKEENHQADEQDSGVVTVKAGPADEGSAAQSGQSDQIVPEPSPSAAEVARSDAPLPRLTARVKRGTGAQSGPPEPVRASLPAKQANPPASLQAPEATPHAAAAASGLDAYREAVRKSPEDPGAHHNLARALAAQGDLENAVVEYHNALYLAPSEVESHIGLGEILLKQRNFDGAFTEFRVAAGLKPDDPRAHYNEGLALYAKGTPTSLDTAVSEYEEAVRLRPADADAHYALGLALAQKGKLDAAIAQYRESLRLSPENAPVREQLDRALQKKGEQAAEPKDSEREPAVSRADGTPKAEGDTQPKDSQPEPAATRVNVVSHLQAAKLTFGPKPQYPSFAKTAGIQGTVRLEIVITKDGTVGQLKVLSGDPALAEAAQAAVRRWRYQPTVLNGTPVEVVTEVDLRFVL